MKKARNPISGERLPKDYRLAHNFVRPTTADQRHGTHGFRRFWIPQEYIEEGKWVECDCGWRPDLGIHYRNKDVSWT
jgi:hypothetical protein